MEHEQVTREIARHSARIYIPLSVGAALLFLLAASLTGDYTLVARLGGAVWVGLLTLIVTTPLVTTRLKERSSRAQ
jgi:peptidoglycan/LPS O-acetylase OafA/YrhL